MSTTTARHREATDGSRDRPGSTDGGGARLSKIVLANVILLTMIAPLSTDMYVSAFPVVGRDLAVGATGVQLTLTTFFVGMALGQLVGGPVSDQRGRRRPLVAAIVVLTLASTLCALTPSIGLMLVARFVQGFSGGWAMVIARSVVVDLTRGPRLVRSLNLVAGVAGIAPIVGPLLGALLLQLSGWRVSFWLLAAWAAAMIVSVVIALPESLPVERRHGGGLHRLHRSAGQVLARPGFVGYLVVMAFSMGVIFAYIATSAFVLQSMNGLSPLMYSVDFSFNAVGLAVATFVSARLAGRVPTRTVVFVGIAATGAAGVLLLIGSLTGMPLWIALLGFFVLVSAQGLVGPNAGALASAEVPEHPGTGSAVLGFVQWSVAGVIAPIAGLGGEQTALPMAGIVLALVVLSFAALARASRRPAAPRATQLCDPVAC